MGYATLKVTGGPMAGQRLPITRRDMTIGRGQAAGLRAAGYEEISREHARLRWDGNGFVIDDLGSRNGTVVDGAPVPSTRLRSGSVIALGDFTAELQVPEPWPTFDDVPAAPGPNAPQPPYANQAAYAQSPDYVSPRQYAPRSRSGVQVSRGLLALGAFLLLAGLGITYRIRVVLADTGRQHSRSDIFVAPQHDSDTPSGGGQPAQTASSGAGGAQPSGGAGDQPAAGPGSQPTSGGATDQPAGGAGANRPSDSPVGASTGSDQPTGSSSTPGDADQAIRDATVLVARKSADGKYHVAGAGVFVTPHVVLTTRHAVCETSDAPAGDLELVLYIGTPNQKFVEVPAAQVHVQRPVAGSSELLTDAAAIDVSADPGKPLPMGATSALSDGDQLTVAAVRAGSSLSISLSHHTLKAAVPDQNTHTTALLALDEPSEGELAGAAVVNSRGQLVGIVLGRENNDRVGHILVCLTLAKILAARS